jgi:hypothetical protein
MNVGNYSAHAIDEIKRNLGALGRNCAPFVVKGVESDIEAMSAAPKFWLDEESVALDTSVGSSFQGLLRLPFSTVVIEFPCAILRIKSKQPLIVDRSGRAKSILVAREMPNQSGVEVRTYLWRNYSPQWMPCGVAAILPFEYQGTWDEVVFAPEWVSPAYVPHATMTGSVWPVVSLCAFLSCLNVTTETVLPSDKINTKRLKRGQAPFDVYRVLTVEAASGRGGAGDGHRSPREHLRRGHIRRLSPDKQVWVSSTVVNPGAPGRVNKTYRIAAE